MNTITLNTDECVTLYMMVMDRITECDKMYNDSVKYSDTEGAEYWSKEKKIALSIQSKLDGGF